MLIYMNRRLRTLRLDCVTSYIWVTYLTLLATMLNTDACLGIQTQLYQVGKNDGAVGRAASGSICE